MITFPYIRGLMLLALFIPTTMAFAVLICLLVDEIWGWHRD